MSTFPWTLSTLSLLWRKKRHRLLPVSDGEFERRGRGGGRRREREREGEMESILECDWASEASPTYDLNTDSVYFIRLVPTDARVHNIKPCSLFDYIHSSSPTYAAFSRIAPRDTGIVPGA